MKREIDVVIRMKWRDALLIGMAILLVTMFTWAFWVVNAGQKGQDAARVEFEVESESHRCRSEQLLRALLAAHKIKVPPYPEGAIPPHNCKLP